MTNSDHNNGGRHIRLGVVSTKGGLLAISGQTAGVLVQFLSLIILARLLTPADFGLLAMTTGITGFLATIKDLGFGQAIIQNKSLDLRQVSQLFWINVGASALLSAAIASLAYPISLLYHEPKLIPITAALAGTAVFSGIGVQHRALIQRDLRFGIATLNTLLPVVSGSTAAILAAWNGMGYWSLVVNVAVSSFVSGVIPWLFCDWRPRLPVFPMREIRRLLNFGINVTVFNSLNYAARNVDNILIGWRWGASILGTYSGAYQIFMLPLIQISFPAGQVVIPTLSRIDHRSSEYANIYYEVLMAVSLLALPIAMYGYIFSDIIIPLALGPKWTPAISIFKLLAVSTPAQIIYNSLAWIYLSNGRTKSMLWWGVFASSGIILSFISGVNFGATGVATAYSAMMTFLMIPGLIAACRKTAITPGRALFAVGCPTMISLCSGFLANWIDVDLGGGLSPIVRAAVGAAVFILCYTVLIGIIPVTRRFVYDVYRRLFQRG